MSTTRSQQAPKIRPCAISVRHGRNEIAAFMSEVLERCKLLFVVRSSLFSSAEGFHLFKIALVSSALTESSSIAISDLRISLRT